MISTQYVSWFGASQLLPAVQIDTHSLAPRSPRSCGWGGTSAVLVITSRTAGSLRPPLSVSVVRPTARLRSIGFGGLPRVIQHPKTDRYDEIISNRTLKDKEKRT